MSVITRAASYAGYAHGTVQQLRKYTKEQYIVHPEEVAYLVSLATRDEDVIAAAWLHDTIEDTPVEYGHICANFGKRIADLVLEVTDVSKPEDGNRAVRKAMDREHLANASADAQTIKLADLISNTYSITKYDPGFAKVYLAEKRALMSVLTKGNKRLREVCISILEENGA